jgi:hypothetical protein
MVDCIPSSVSRHQTRRLLCLISLLFILICFVIHFESLFTSFSISDPLSLSLSDSATVTRFKFHLQFDYQNIHNKRYSFFTSHSNSGVLTLFVDASQSQSVNSNWCI